MRPKTTVKTTVYPWWCRRSAKAWILKDFDGIFNSSFRPHSNSCQFSFFVFFYIWKMNKKNSIFIFLEDWKMNSLNFHFHFIKREIEKCSFSFLWKIEKWILKDGLLKSFLIFQQKWKLKLTKIFIFHNSKFSEKWIGTRVHAFWTSTDFYFLNRYQK